MLSKINGTPIEQVKYTKCLELYIDDELTWKYHINQFTSKTSKMKGIIARARHYLAHQSVVTIYNTMIHPYLQYGDDYLEQHVPN